MDLREAVLSYLRKGLAVVPIEAGTKHPPRSLTGWQNLRLTEGLLSSYFVPGCGVGILTGAPSGGICDVDLDCEEAVALAPHLLPPTSVWSGRDSRPRSHAWYRCTPVPKNATLLSPDEKKDCLVELRADGRQTMVWPSVHPEGDHYKWSANGKEPAQVTGSALETAVRKLAAACLLARAWPREPGSRHGIANALAGLLTHGGWGEDEVASFVRIIADAAHDDEASGREQTARATSRRHAAGQQVTGAPSLASILGKPVVDRVGEWLGLSWTDRPSLAAGRGDEAWAATRLWPKSLGEAAYHGLAGEFVRLVEPHTEADPVALLVQFLVAYGNVVGQGPHFRVEADRHRAGLFVALVGQSSKGRKGTAWGQALRPIASLDEVWASHCQQSGLSSGEGLIWAVRDPISKREPVRQKGRVVDYQDIEVDAGVADKRLLVFESEFASTLRVMCRDGSTLSPTVRQAWDTGDLSVLTKNCPARATAAHISIVSHITADELRRYLDRTELGNGFANRFLWICVRRSRVLPEGGRLEGVDFAPLLAGLSQAFKFAQDHGDAEVGIDEEARDLWREVYPGLSEGKPGLLGTVISRAEAQVRRLALVYALLDSSPVVCRAHLEAALEVWRYAEESAEFVFGDVLGDPVADELLTALRKAGPEGMSRAELSEHFGRNRRASEIQRGLALLSEQGLARGEREQTGGRPAERWFASREYERNEENEGSPPASRSSEATKSLFRFFRTPESSETGATPAPGGEQGGGQTWQGYLPDHWEVIAKLADGQDDIAGVTGAEK
jgi:hypothetical protein